MVVVKQSLWLKEVIDDARVPHNDPIRFRTIGERSLSVLSKGVSSIRSCTKNSKRVEGGNFFFWKKTKKVNVSGRLE